MAFVLLSGAVFADAALANPAADEAAIRARLHGWAAAFNSGDVDGACGLFSDDVQSTVPGTLSGDKNAICDRLRAAIGKTDRKLSYAANIHEVLISGDQAVVRLTWTLNVSRDGKTATSTEEGMDVFHRQPDGQWQIVRFIAFTNREGDR
jgi:steroid delta-isomerase